MNESGDAVAKAYRQYVSSAAAATRSQDDGWPTLVILHDEMELAPGQLKLGPGSASAKGHNGLKSMQQSLQSTGLGGRLTAKNGKFLRVGFGIGETGGVD
ncbi:hypothetical protein PG994_000479 [Apiospora phragmitis]|uniref:peptidyl-tRNA hydrolase n=1 Tax=Apiospora phragmitis TaxID=2905665 RepID=A0ABR1X6I4_9PEZI